MPRLRFDTFTTYLTTFVIVSAFMLLSHPAFAGTLGEDLKEARSLIMGNLSEGPLGRGMFYPLFQPATLASLFCIGLWTGLSTDKVNTIWAIPISFFVAIVIGAFISQFHGDWKPDMGSLTEDYPELPSLLSTEGISLMIAIAVGTVVTMNFTAAPLITLIVTAILGFILGSSNLEAIAEDASDKSVIIPFWTGFGFTGLLLTIFGIGFETFAKSVNMVFLIRLAGFFTAVAGLASISSHFTAS